MRSNPSAQSWGVSQGEGLNMPLRGFSGADARVSVSRDPWLLDQMRERICSLDLAMRSETAQTR